MKGLMVVMFGWMTACIYQKTAPSSVNYKQEMRNLVQNISHYAKAIRPNFAIIPQNGVRLVSNTAEPNGTPNIDYINAIDGIGQESLLYGYHRDNKQTPTKETAYTRSFLELAKQQKDLAVMVTDYCSSPSKVEVSYSTNAHNNYLSFAADHRNLDNIPTYPLSIQGENAVRISKLQQAKNFLYLINPAEFASRQALVDAVKRTNYDLIIMDFFFDGRAYTPAQIAALKQKANGGKRMLISYLSIGEAETYRYYWQQDWRIGSPSFIVKENTNWKGNYVVKYWDKDWQKIIFGNDTSYLKKIMDAGFDGVYLDIVDAFEAFEK